jgi:methionyl-tRNA formyltransferase
VTKTAPQPKAVVFAYHEVGVRCLATLLAHGVAVPMVVTHADDPAERRWFASAAETADLNGIPVIQPDSPAEPGVAEKVAACAPDFLFSFYYRHLLPPALLQLARRGDYNMHGSLLPRYRGRAPVNWAVLHGERETGASLHRMVARADAGALVGQSRVPILPNDTAVQVFYKVTWAAESLLDRQLPVLLAGRAEHVPLDLAHGSYYGRRRPADGHIDWRQPAWDVHNLIRAVAPPYPGAFFDIGGRRVSVLGSHYRAEPAASSYPPPVLYWDGGACFADCVDGQRLRILDIRLAGKTLDENACRRQFGTTFLALPQGLHT